jgi:hypothetical protein
MSGACTKDGRIGRRQKTLPGCQLQITLAISTLVVRCNKRAYNRQCFHNSEVTEVTQEPTNGS